MKKVYAVVTDELILYRATLNYLRGFLKLLEHQTGIHKHLI